MSYKVVTKTSEVSERSYKKKSSLFSGGKLCPNRVEAEGHISSCPGSQLKVINIERCPYQKDFSVCFSVDLM